MKKEMSIDMRGSKWGWNKKGHYASGTPPVNNPDFNSVNTSEGARKLRHVMLVQW